MPSNSKIQEAHVSGEKSSSQKDNQQSYMLREFLHAEPTISERLYRVAQSEEKGNENKGYDDNAKEEIRKFENVWRN